MEPAKCQYHSSGCDGKCRRDGCIYAHEENSWFCSIECQEKYWEGTGANTRPFTQMHAEFAKKTQARTAERPIPDYESMATPDLEEIKEIATDFMNSIGVNDPQFSEANRRYMLIEDILTERHVREEVINV